MKSFVDFYCLKNGAEVKKWQFPDDAECLYWALACSQYIREAIRNIDVHLQSQNRTLKKAHQPFPTNYHPESDIMPLLPDEEINFYQSQVSTLC
jgi:hypothetical protein